MVAQTPTVQLRVGSQWITSHNKSDSTAVYNPSTGKEIASTPVGCVQDVDDAVAAASAALADSRDRTGMRFTDLPSRNDHSCADSSAVKVMHA